MSNIINKQNIENLEMFLDNNKILTTTANTPKEICKLNFYSKSVPIKRRKKTNEYMLELALRIIFYKVHKIKSKFLNFM